MRFDPQEAAESADLLSYLSTFIFVFVFVFVLVFAFVVQTFFVFVNSFWLRSSAPPRATSTKFSLCRTKSCTGGKEDEVLKIESIFVSAFKKLEGKRPKTAVLPSAGIAACPQKWFRPVNFDSWQGRLSLKLGRGEKVKQVSSKLFFTFAIGLYSGREEEDIWGKNQYG